MSQSVSFSLLIIIFYPLKGNELPECIQDRIIEDLPTSCLIFPNFNENSDKKKKQNNVVSYFYREMLFLLSLFHFFSHQSKEKNDNFLLKINNYVSLLNI